MAHVYRTNLEDVAVALQSLKWHEMVELADHLAHIEVDGAEGRDFWASILHDWSSEKVAEYDLRCEESK